jgi:hypothetical protein
LTVHESPTALERRGVRAKAANEAFDNAWLSVAHQFIGYANATDKARVMLAEFVQAVARDGDTDVAQIERLWTRAPKRDS